MYVYIKNIQDGIPVWTVGFYNPDCLFFVESKHATPEAAANQVSFLNGGRNSADQEAETQYERTNSCISNMLDCIIQLQAQQEKLTLRMQQLEEDEAALKCLTKNCQQIDTQVEELNCRVLCLEDPVKTN
jgi:hypothetical protein